MVWRNAGGICERKILFQMKKEADQAGFKSTHLMVMIVDDNCSLATMLMVGCFFL